jgi:transposase InsO family protein
VIDDHSRLFICSHAYSYVKTRDVVESFHCAAELHGLPAALLSDNGAVFTGTARHGKVQLQTELEQLGVAAKNSRPYHPQTCGKIERLHQTLKRYLDKQPPAATLKDLQAPAQRVRPLLQPHPPAPGTRRPLTATGLHLTHQGPARQPASEHLLPDPPRQGRRHWQGQPAPSQPTLQNRRRKSPQRPTGQAPHRRPERPRHRPQRPATTPTHARPQPHLPAHHNHLSCPTSPETRVQHVPRHNTKADEGTRTLDLLHGKQTL